ncbi:WD40 repeat domain-containing protein [Microcoleus sp. B5-D4]|uniref:WD40 repeat domain-containing protein n=1 Tax=unclassified Microcoleus TaxID=2642155 RepID=UPI002FD47D42
MSNHARVKTILILAANPKNTAPLRLDQEIREIDEGLRRANKRELYKLEQKWAVRSRDFYRAILDYQPNIVHFCGHGAGEDGIVLEDDTGKMALVQTNALASMFKLFAKKGVECVILNACYSEVQADAISQYVNYVVGMNRAVGDKAAVAFAVAFYDGIAAGYEIEEAYDLGRSQMMSFLEHETPVFKKNNLRDAPLDDGIIAFEDVIPPNPYQGLSAFKEEDADFFFGQEKFVNKLVEVTQTQPLVAVVGPSGSGKSSVVYAGLIPKLRKEGIWLIESFRPGKEPFLPLASALVRQLEPEAGETQKLREAVGLADDLQNGRITLPQVVSRILERNPGKRLLLVADQFEELYTLCQVKEEQERFANELLTAIAQKNITLVLTLRADFYGYVLSYRPFRDALQEYTPQLLSSMKREELQAAIELPAQKLAVQLEPQLTQRILDDVGQEPGNLPLLEFALTRLWEKQINRELTHQAYEEIGGVKKAIANHAEQVYQKLNETEKKQAQRIFVQLVRPGEGTEDTRRVATRAEVGEDNWNLVSYLAGYQARLVVTGRQEPEDTVEVVHEALIREWGTLREWMNANRQFRTWQERLKVALREWKNNNHDSGGLLRGASLTVAEDWLRKRSDEMTQEEGDFIQLSVKERDTERQERERGQRLAVLGLTGGFIVASSLAGLSWWQWQQSAIAQIETLTQSSDLFLTSKNQPFDALIASLKAEKLLKRRVWVDANTRIKIASSLQQAISSVREYNRLDGHKERVSSLITSPDGRLLVSASHDQTIKFWDVATGKLLNTITEPNLRGVSLSFSPDSKTLVSIDYDGRVRFWDIATGKFIKKNISCGKRIWAASFSPDGKTLAVDNESNSIKLCDVNTGKLLHTLIGHNDVISDLRFKPGGRQLASASQDKTIKLWDVTTGKLINTIAEHKKSVRAINFSPDGKTLASASQDETIKLWDVTKSKPVNIRTWPSSGIAIKLSFTPDGKTLASNGENNSIKLWDVSTGKPVQTFIGHSTLPTELNFTSDSKTLASAGGDMTIRLWDVGKNKRLNIITGHNKEITSISFSPDGRQLVSASEDKTIKLWEVATSKLLNTFTGHNKEITSISFSPDGQKLASGSKDKTIKLWNVKTGKVINTFRGHGGGVLSVSFSPNGQQLASGNSDKNVELWDVSTGKILNTFKGQYMRGIRSVSFSPNGRLLASGSWSSEINLWDISTGKLFNKLSGNGSVASVNFSPNGRQLVSGDVSNIKLWDTTTGEVLDTFFGHTRFIWSANFSPDGKTLVSAGEDKTIKLWDVATGKLLNTLTGHQEEVKTVSFSPNGKLLASAGKDKTIILWNLDLDDLRKGGCNWVRPYLQNNPNVSDSDRHLCDGIPTNQ